ncbi:endopeptidase La [Holospora curviuscula]|uniref:Lon protease n=1 Tax=Holospora curviuscula TaxID=1082868 RepID=A0A2S5RHZ1_9PROT|nr:endopeptidase La [Holospora curviuscula]PPE06923.1 Lon protease [Holospora curviuscula]
MFDPESVKKCSVIISEDVVFFPFTAGILAVKHGPSVEVIENVMKESQENRYIVLCTQIQNKSQNKSVKGENIFPIGTLCRIRQSTFVHTECQVVLEGLQRVHVVLDQEGVTGSITPLKTQEEPRAKIEATFRVLKNHLEQYLKLNAQDTTQRALIIEEKEPVNIEQIVYKISGNINNIEKKQKILQSDSLINRMKLLIEWLSFEVTIGKFKETLSIKAAQKMRTDYQEYVRRTKEEILKRESGDQDLYQNIEKKIQKAKHLTQEAKRQAEEELKKLRLLPQSSPEVSSIQSYIEFLVDLPWKKVRPLNKDLQQAETVLKESHSGMDKINERILEFLAVHRRRKTDQGGVLCLVGPPGVGKTSIAKAIAKALNLDFTSIALGGCGDEAEIRGHRRTYIGAAPGRILKALQFRNGGKHRPGSNSVVLLDEIDKLGADRRGDPYAALLEVLDPEQNSEFRDHYLEIPYDLRKIFFIATANKQHDIPAPLRDRMELIHLSGYTTQEKIQIAQNHLIPGIMREHCLTTEQFTLTSPALYDLLTQYTPKEAGVRGLKERIGALARKVVLKLEMNIAQSETIHCQQLSQYLGTPIHPARPHHTKPERIGVMTGLAWTEAGGDTMHIEAVHVIGKGKTFFTGKLGDTMKESVQVALNCLKENIAHYHLDPKIFTENDIHVHFPENAIPKDGPSAGVGIFLTLLSLCSKKPIPSTTAVTGEITTKGEILRIGGLKEKLIAAVNHDIDTVLLPEHNRQDLDDIPTEIIQKLHLVFVTDIHEAVHYLFPNDKEPTPEV